jgi:hypothetical protein
MINGGPQNEPNDFPGELFNHNTRNGGCSRPAVAGLSFAQALHELPESALGHFRNLYFHIAKTLVLLQQCTDSLLAQDLCDGERIGHAFHPLECH